MLDSMLVLEVQFLLLTYVWHPGPTVLIQVS